MKIIESTESAGHRKNFPLTSQARTRTFERAASRRRSVA